MCTLVILNVCCYVHSSYFQILDHNDIEMFIGTAKNTMQVIYGDTIFYLLMWYKFNREMWAPYPKDRSPQDWSVY